MGHWAGSCYLPGMTSEYSRTVGRRQAVKAVTIGLGLAYLFFAGFSQDPGWLRDFSYAWPHLAVAALLMYLCAYVYGGWAGAIILAQPQKAGWIGAGCGLWTLLTVTFLASWVGFFQEGLAKMGTSDNPFFDYLVKPLVWVTVVGCLPAVLVGWWFGDSIRRTITRG